MGSSSLTSDGTWAYGTGCAVSATGPPGKSPDALSLPKVHTLYRLPLCVIVLTIAKRPVPTISGSHRTVSNPPTHILPLSPPQATTYLFTDSLVLCARVLKGTPALFMADAPSSREGLEATQGLRSGGLLKVVN